MPAGHRAAPVGAVANGGAVYRLPACSCPALDEVAKVMLGDGLVASPQAPQIKEGNNLVVFTQRQPFAHRRVKHVLATTPHGPQLQGMRREQHAMRSTA